MWWMAGPQLERRCASERGERHGKAKASATRKSHSYFARDRDIDEFREVLRAKFETLTRAWRLGLDPGERGFLQFGDFVKAVKRVGYEGNVRSLWYNLDHGQAGVATSASHSAHFWAPPHQRIGD
mmetsp:Transcript_53065/g.123516  ORF Transcript_53065/g.123516 Transcript_53065/m.123516 type:complete len:125 (+) Transcript_53065:59-433(+)